LAFGQWVDNGVDAKHGVGSAKVGQKLSHHIQPAANTNTQTAMAIDMFKAIGMSMIILIGH